MQAGRAETPVSVSLSLPERHLVARDARLSQIIACQTDRWPSDPTEDPVWGLIRIVVAQQISTRVACKLAEKIKSAYPHLAKPSPTRIPKPGVLRKMGLPESRANCCLSILRQSDQIRAKVQQGQTWEEALAGIKGIGPWTVATFRIMVLRDPDVLPIGDVGLARAVTNVYGAAADLQCLSEAWRPFRSVACWYLWRTLGNEQLG